MRALPIALSIGSCLLAISSVSADRRVEHREDFSFTKEAGSGSNLSVDNVNGSVQIRGVAGLSQIRITGTKIATGRTAEDAKNHIGDIVIDVAQNDGGIAIRTKHPNGSGDRNYTVSYMIEVPKNWKVKAHVVNGSVAIAGIANGAYANITNGELETDDIAGEFEANIANGNIKGNAHISPNTRCNLRTANGSIDATLQVASSAACNLQTLNGRITLALPPATSAGVSASTLTGKISVEDLEFSNRVSTRPNMIGEEFKGTLGGGASSIALQTNNGQIVLKAAE